MKRCYHVNFDLDHFVQNSAAGRRIFELQFNFNLIENPLTQTLFYCISSRTMAQIRGL